jgi:hypothetical protein
MTEILLGKQQKHLPRSYVCRFPGDGSHEAGLSLSGSIPCALHPCTSQLAGDMFFWW